MTEFSSVSELSGVGKTRLSQLNKLGIYTIRDLIFTFPRAYENRSVISLLAEERLDTDAAYILTVSSEVKSAKLRGNLTVSKFRAFDESGSCEVIFFNSPFIKDVFHVGAEFRFYGKLTKTKNKLSLSVPKYEPYVPGIPLRDYLPIYHLTEGLSGKVLEKLVNLALNAALSTIIDPLPEKIRLEENLPTIQFALKNIHAPETPEALMRAIRRLAFDEMLYFGLGIALSKQYKSKVPGVAFKPTSLKEFTDLLPYTLTDSQKNTINDVYSDTVIKTKDKNFGHMARIVVGDVGSGKTACAAASIFIAAKSGFQSALMAPTEILARQHYEEISKLFGKLGFKTSLLIGSMTQKQKNEVYKSVESGETNVLIGTHALLSENLNFNSLGLIVTDEQHRFGVQQRAVLNEKNASAHMLVMSATPIPRTLALAMYGDLDVSQIKEMPKGRMKVDTFVVDETYRERLNGFIQKQVENGGQCYVVCPAIEEKIDGANEYSFYLSEEKSKSQNIKNVLNYADNLRQTFPNLQIEVLHGKLKSKEKDEIMARFSSGEAKILVSTTVIEVGVNVPNASLMIIENADRYGLSQLHQLRGRVGRGTRKSYCVLVSNLNTEKAKARLNVMKETNDGFEIANKDLELRGPGDFFKFRDSDSYRQSGGFNFKLATLTDDVSIMDSAFSRAKSIVSKDPDLSSEENSLLKAELEKIIAPITSTIS